VALEATVEVFEVEVVLVGLGRNKERERERSVWDATSDQRDSTKRS